MLKGGSSRNYNIMRPTRFDPSVLRQHLRHRKIADLPDLKRVLGLWSHEGVWFSRQATLLATVEAFVNRSSHGYYSPELADALHAQVQESLRHLNLSD